MTAPEPKDADGRAALEASIRAALDAGDRARAATELLAGYGPEILRYLISLSRDETAAGDAFSQFCENLWLGLATFRGEASVRVWAYALARHAWYRVLRDPHRRRARVPLSDVPSVEQAAATVRSRTADYLRTANRDKIAALRAALEPDDQALLVLRINRKMAWGEIARALADPEEPLATAEVERRAASLRKRFQRLKDELRAQVGKDE